MHGVIAAGHAQTAAAGAEMLQQGGNAVDAAVAASFASFVAESALVNIGGGGIAQVYNPATQRAMVYDFFSTMPGLSPNGDSPPVAIDFRKKMVDFGAAQQPFYIGRGSVAVPGVVAGLCAMAQEQGTLPLSQILAPTIRMARQGVVLSRTQEYIVQLLEPILTDTPDMAAIYAPNGQIVSAGHLLRFPALADTLEQLGREGASLFYTGRVAQKILADQRARGGLLTAADLSTYQVLHTQPIPVNYRGYTILLPPPSSGGGPLIAFALKLLATFSVAELPRNGFEHLRLLGEVMRLTNVARAEWAANHPHRFGAAVTQRPVQPLLADDNVQRYHRKLEQVLARQDSVSEPPLPKGPANTTHISVADAGGLIVSITTSAGENAGFVVDDTGVMLNNMLGEIDLNPNGFHQLPPGRRMLTMMSPALVLHDGQPILAVGSGGSNRLRSAILQVISNVLDFNLPLTDAVGAPRLHFEANEMQLEGGIDAAVAANLDAAGYTVNLWPARNMFFGGAHAVDWERTPGDKRAHWTAAGDSRRGGAVVVVD